MTQSAGGPNSSFQPIIQMESAFQAWLLLFLSVFLFFSFCSSNLWHEPRNVFVMLLKWQPDGCLMLWRHNIKEEWGQLFIQNRVAIWQRLQSQWCKLWWEPQGRKWRPVKRFNCEGFCWKSRLSRDRRQCQYVSLCEEV